MSTPTAWALVRRFWARNPGAAVAVLLIAAATFWSYWPTLVQLYGSWIHDPQYSHGLLVPALKMIGWK